MSTRSDIIYSEDLGTGAPVGITGATTEVRVIRLADNYVLNSGGSFVDPSTAPTLPTMTEDASNAGHYYYTLPSTTSWSNGYYSRVCTLYKTGKGPLQQTDEFTVTNGVYTPAAGPGSPTSLDYCRVYVYLGDTPSTEPTSVVTYESTPWNADTAPDYTPTPVYSSGTGLWYVDLLRSEVARIVIAAYGISKAFVVPDSTTTALPAI